MNSSEGNEEGGKLNRRILSKLLLVIDTPLKVAMFKAFFTAAAFVLASSPAFVSAQDFFFSFDEFSRVPTTTVGVGAVTGSVFLFADENVDFNSADIDFTNSDSSVVAFTSGTAFDTAGNKFFAPPAIDSPSDPNGPSATDGRYFAASGLQLGIDPANAATDPEFRAGANGFLLARVDYDIIGPVSYTHLTLPTNREV